MGSDTVMRPENILLQKVLVTVQEGLTDLGLECLRDHMRATFVQDDLARRVIFKFETWAAGGSMVPVCFRKEVQVIVPATWWDHLKDDLMACADRRGYIRLGAFLEKRIKERTIKRVVSETKQVATRICPHVSIPDHRGESIHVAWMDGREGSPWKA